MKIDKARPSHWLSLTFFGLNVLAAWSLRWLCRSKRKPVVILYGHKLNGNLLAIYRHWQSFAKTEFDFVFLTMDRGYHQKLKAEGFCSVLATRLGALILLIKTDAVVSDHGLHVLQFMVGRSDIKFFDVWHGIPFKGFDKNDFQLQRRYHEVWVASDLMRQLYVKRYKFDAKKVYVTGYARTDLLVHQDTDLNAAKRDLGLDKVDTGKVILFAPTWAQDESGRSIYPFGLDEATFVRSLSDVADRMAATVVVRSHLNSRFLPNDYGERILQRPFAKYPDTESLLLVSDILVCDWSSIAFDWLLLDRPTVFLDVPAPFKKGFSLGPEYRFGCLASSLDSLVLALEESLKSDAGTAGECRDRQSLVKADVYGDVADGKAAERCLDRLRFHCFSGGSFQ